MLADYPREKIREVVRLTHNDMEKALQLLLDGGLQEDEPLPEKGNDFNNYSGYAGMGFYEHPIPVLTVLLANTPPVNEKYGNTQSYGDYVDSDDEPKNRSGLTASQEVLLILQQEEALM